MTPNEMRAILQVAKEFNVKNLKLGELSVEFDSAPVVESGLPTESNPTEDELLYWSTSELPDVRASKPSE